LWCSSFAPSGSSGTCASSISRRRRHIKFWMSSVTLGDLGCLVSVGHLEG
jgi:hypothetical protein